MQPEFGALVPPLTRTRDRPSYQMNNWLLAIALAVPAFFPLAAHYIGYLRIGLFPTGFIQYDQPYYFANARELTDSGHLSLFYGNPFTFNYATPRIYFQPLTVLIALCERLTGADPGLLMAVLCGIASVICIRLAIALFDFFATENRANRVRSIIVFIWGGGLLAVAGLLFSLLQGQQAQGIFYLDPIRGWWFQNLGRNFVYPTEATYHAIFFAAVLLILRRRFTGATVLLALMSVSHPFTGLHLLSIVAAWCVLEIVVLRSGVVPRWFLLACVILAAAHVGYYLIYLSHFAEHQSLQAQWTRPFLFPVDTFVFANILVGLFAVWRMPSLRKAKQVLTWWPNRLLLVWFTVTAVLVNHDHFMRPVQPLHFSRGYLWIPLFLLGLPVLLEIFTRLAAVRPRIVAVATTAALMIVLLSDNITWLGVRSAQALGIGAGNFGLSKEVGNSPTPLASSTLGFGLTRDQLDVLRIMNERANRGFVVVSQDSTLGYLSTVYSPLRSWRSHHYNTPETMRRRTEIYDFFDSGSVNSAWEKLPILFVFFRSAPSEERLNSLSPGSTSLIFTNSSYVVARHFPR